MRDIWVLVVEHLFACCLVLMCLLPGTDWNELVVCGWLCIAVCGVLFIGYLAGLLCY